MKSDQHWDFWLDLDWLQTMRTGKTTKWYDLLTNFLPLNSSALYMIITLPESKRSPYCIGYNMHPLQISNKNHIFHILRLTWWQEGWPNPPRSLCFAPCPPQTPPQSQRRTAHSTSPQTWTGRTQRRSLSAVSIWHRLGRYWKYHTYFMWEKKRHDLGLHTPSGVRLFLLILPYLCPVLGLSNIV